MTESLSSAKMPFLHNVERYYYFSWSIIGWCHMKDTLLELIRLFLSPTNKVVYLNIQAHQISVKCQHLFVWKAYIERLQIILINLKLRAAFSPDLILRKQVFVDISDLQCQRYKAPSKDNLGHGNVLQHTRVLFLHNYVCFQSRLGSRVACNDSTCPLPSVA